MNGTIQVVKRQAYGASVPVESEAVESVSGTVLRATALLDVLVEYPRGMGLTALAQRANLHKATVYRLLGALQRAHLVVQDVPLGPYRPGLKLVRMATRILDALDFRVVAQAHIERLAAATGHAALASVLEREHIVYVAVSPGQGPLLVYHRIGNRYPFDLTASGRTIVAFLPSAEGEAVLRRAYGESVEPRTIEDLQSLRDGLTEIRQRGWDFIQDTVFVGVSALAGPVFDQRGRVVGAIAITGPSLAFPIDRLGDYLDHVRAACRRVSAELGYRGDSNSP